MNDFYPSNPIETSTTTPEQEIKDVFKTAPENKVWMPGEAFPAAALLKRFQAAQTETAITLTEVQKQIEQIKAFQTHGT